MSLLDVFLLFAAVFGWYRAYTFQQAALRYQDQLAATILDFTRRMNRD